MVTKLPIGLGCDRDDAETWPTVYICDSRDHEPAFATKLLHWVTGPVHYCDRCATAMLRVAEALGTHVAIEALPAPPTVEPVRGIALSGRDICRS